MDAIDQALAQVRAEIERIQQYLEQLQQTERELATLQGTRQVIVRGWRGQGDLVPNGITSTATAVSQKPPQNPTTLKTEQPLVAHILQLLQATGRAMTPAEIDAALRSEGRQMHENAVTSALSRLLKGHRLVKHEGARYSVPTHAGSPRDDISGQDDMGLRPTSLAGQAYLLLKEAGRPLSGEEISMLFQAKGKQVNPRSVITALYHCAQDGQFFRRVGSKTFGLLEWEDTVIQPATSPPGLEADEQQTTWHTLEWNMESDKEN